MKVLVIGGNGFIGSHLVTALRMRGDEVAVLDRFPPRSDIDWHEVRYYLGDFYDRAILDKVLPGIDQVYHLASSTVPGSADADPVADIQGNLLGTHELLAAMRSHGARRLCYFSSGGTVYGNPDRVPVAESHPLRPISSYGIVKVAVEQYLTMFQRQGWLDPVIIRPSNPYGPRQSTSGIQGAIASFLGKAKDGGIVNIWGDGTVIRDYIYVDDLVELAIKAARQNINCTVNAGSGEGHSLNDICALIRAVTKLELPVEFQPGRAFDVKQIVLDVSAARRLFEWCPRTALADGIACTWNSLHSN